MSEKVNQIVTERIMGMLEKGRIPWVKPWNSRGGRPKNAITGKVYRGINALICSPMVSGYQDPNWYPKGQLKKLGFTLKEEHQGPRSYTPVVYWNWTEKKKEGGGIEKVPFTTFFQCYNRQQIEGSEILWPIEEAKDNKPVEQWECEAHSIALKYEEASKLRVNRNGVNASYCPSTDTVTVPSRADHTSAAEYWSTFFHEITHSTGAKKRLNREEGMKGMKGNHAYSKEELVAEMGACFLLADLGVEKHIENSAAYIQGWLEKLKGERKFLMQAAQQAAKSCDYVRGESYNAK